MSIPFKDANVKTPPEWNPLPPQTKELRNAPCAFQVSKISPMSQEATDAPAHAPCPSKIQGAPGRSFACLQLAAGWCNTLALGPLGASDDELDSYRGFMGIKTVMSNSIYLLHNRRKTLAEAPSTPSSLRRCSSHRRKDPLSP
jgi:hypothetical protein